MENIVSWLKKLWNKINPFDLPHWFGVLSDELEGVKTHIDKHSDSIKETMDSLEQKLDDDIKFLEKELEFHKNLLFTIGNTIPDMMWAKDLDGKYIYANDAIKKGLLFEDYPIGKTDIELAKKAKARFGEENHTFGEVCGNSDKDIIETGTPTRFFEYGKVQGEMMYLEVYKAPLYVDDIFVGVCGTGRDLTPYVKAYRERDCGRCPAKPEDDIFDMFKFENKDV